MPPAPPSSRPCCPPATARPRPRRSRWTTRAWGIRSFGPVDLRRTTQPLPDWLAGTGCSRIAVHFDVDTVDSNEIVLGLGAEPHGPTSAQVQRILDDLDRTADVVGHTIAEFIPRQVMHLQQILGGFPLIGGSGSPIIGAR
jgi:arginase